MAQVFRRGWPDDPLEGRMFRRRIGKDVEQMEAVQPALEGLLGRFRGYFRRGPTFEHFRTYVGGLLSDLKRKNVEAIALAADTAVRSLQEFLHRVVHRSTASPGFCVCHSSGREGGSFCR